MSLDPDAAKSASPPGARPLVSIRTDEARYSAFPNYIFGIHDTGGEAHMLAAEKPGWVLVSVRVKPPDHDGDFSSLAGKGLGVIVRLNNGYLSAGSIPNSTQYDRFALRCAEYVAGSRGAHIWIIGDEPNNALQRPGNDGTDNSGEVITPEMYARCFNGCRAAIRDISGHENDWVIPAAIAPYKTHTNYPKNASGDWVRYMADTLFQISLQRGRPDGIALHAYTHGHDLALVTSESMAAGHFSNRHWNFRAYRDFLAAVPPAWRSLPVFITEAQPLEPGWTSENHGWIQAACGEINSWNSKMTNQPIQALCFHRWQPQPGDTHGAAMSERPEVIEDFVSALKGDYRVKWPGLPTKPDYRADWLETPTIPENGLETKELIEGSVTIRNSGVKVWPTVGPNAVSMVCRWLDDKGTDVTPYPYGEGHAFGSNVPPGQTATLESVRIRAPSRPGVYTLIYDLTLGKGGRFDGHASKSCIVPVGPPPYAVEWEHVIQLSQNGIEPAAKVVGQVLVKNVGSLAWQVEGANPVKLGYRWYDFQGAEMPVPGYPGEFVMNADTPPGGTASFEDVVLCAPQKEGTHTLVWDLLHDGITWFSAKGADVISEGIQVAVPLPDLAAKWVQVFEIPKELEPNETISGTVSLQNTGVQAWTCCGENPVKLHAQWYDPLGNQVMGDTTPIDYSLPADVPAGDCVTIEKVLVRAPVLQGKYTLVFDMASEGVGFFSAAGGRPYDLPVEVKTAAPDNLVEWVESFPPVQNDVVAGDFLSGSIVIRNAGALSWNKDGENPVFLAYRWQETGGQDADVPAGKLPFARDVAPRDTFSFTDISVRAPERPGKYLLEFDVVRDGVGRFGRSGSPTSGVAVTVRPPPLEWGAEFLSHTTPVSLAASQETTVVLQVRNVGTKLWKKDGENHVYAAYSWLDTAGERVSPGPDNHANLERDVPTGEAIEVSARLVAPTTPGQYRLQWDLVVEGGTGFRDGGNPPFSLSVGVTAEPSETNLWRVEASHNGVAGNYAIDGDMMSFWSSETNQVPGMWLRSCFGSPRLLDGIAFRSPGSGFPNAYTLRISLDGEIWRTVWAVPKGNFTDIVASFAPEQVLYAQVDLLAPFEEAWQVGQVQIHLASKWGATSSVNSDAAANVIDNNPETQWASGELQTPGMWFQLDLGRPESVIGLSLSSPQDQIPLGYQVSLWNEPSGRWQKVAERRDNLVPVDVSFAPVESQYIQVQLLQEASRHWAICEAGVKRAMTGWIGPVSL